MLLIPGCRSRMEQPNLVRRGAACQAMAQDIREQVMIAIPLPRVVQRHHEQVGLLQLLQDSLTIAWCDAATLGYGARRGCVTQKKGVAERAAHTVEDGG